MRVRTASDFGPLVAERREALGMSQAELASRVGTSREWVVRMERDSHAVTAFRLMRVLTELKLTLDVDERR